jgi:hypothetical protein
MRTHLTCAAMAVAGFLALASMSASAIECARGVVREGCVGPHGAVVAEKPGVAVVHPPAAVVVHPPVVHPAGVECARGVVREGCVGPHGAAVIRR